MLYTLNLHSVACQLGFASGSVGKESTCNVGNLGSILGLEISLEGGMATHSRILAWRIPMDRGTWWAIVHGVTKSEQLSTAWQLHLNKIGRKNILIKFFKNFYPPIRIRRFHMPICTSTWSFESSLFIQHILQFLHIVACTSPLSF